jgi:malonyl-CoA/methylmalonyl-CoA synthetase
MADENLYQSFERCFARRAGTPAFEGADGSCLMSFDELRSFVARFANALESLGVKPGDRVTAQLEKNLGTVLLYLAVLKTGAVFQPLNSAYTTPEVEYFIADTAPSLVVASRAKTAEVAPIAERCGATYATLDGMNLGSLAGLAAGAADHHHTCPRALDDLAGLLYTSGTTGRAKGAMLTHGNLGSNAQTLHRLWGFVPDDVLLHALPVFHVHGLYVALNTAFLNSSRIIWLENFNVADVLRLLPRATIFMGVPTFYTRLLADPLFNRQTCRSLRLLISGSAPMLPETHAAVLERTGQHVLERYGMTETGMIASNPLHGERVPGTVGFPLPDVDVRIAGLDGCELERGQVGIIEVRGPNVCKGYWRRELQRSEDFRSDGFFITGDIGTMDAQGRLSILGRAKDVIISGGLNVYPREVEQALDALPGIAESAVVGVPHPDFGEAVVAVVTTSSNALRQDDIILELSRSLAGFKVPKRIYVIDELPRNAMGKIQKSELRRRFAGAFADQP